MVLLNTFMFDILFVGVQQESRCNTKSDERMCVLCCELGDDEPEVSVKV